jgi:hypothetical protein
VKSQREMMVASGWRFLLLLDACRYDVFKEVVGTRFPMGDLRPVRSGAMDTLQWYKRHWRWAAPDTCLISAHPYPWSKRLNVAENFELAFPVWEKEENIGRGGVVHPDTLMAEATLIIKAEEFRRYVIHFVQPHLPYVHPAGLDFLEREVGVKMTGDRWLTSSKNVYDAVATWGRKHGWEKPRAHYKASLAYTLRAIKGRLGDLGPGVKVITADHGELLGEGGQYHHPQGGDVEIQQTVPWFEVDLVSHRLAALGYIE